MVPARAMLTSLSATGTFRHGDVLRYSFAGARKGAYPGPQGPVAQLVSAPPCHGGGRGFESRRGRVSGDFVSPTPGQVAQSVVAFA